jgi:hypothetical protein
MCQFSTITPPDLDMSDPELGQQRSTQHLLLLIGKKVSVMDLPSRGLLLKMSNPSPELDCHFFSKIQR